MKRLAPLLALSIAGCLYVGGINHAPELTVAVDQSGSNLTKGGKVMLIAQTVDEDDDPLQLTWWVRGVGLDGMPFGVDRAGAPTAIAPPIPSDATLEITELSRRGNYEVEVEARDPDGATALAKTSFEVVNKPPAFSLELTDDPLTVGRPAHARYIISVREGDAGDDELSCGAGAKVEWELVTPARRELTTWQVQPCKESFELDRLVLSAKAADEELTLEVRATVTDGGGAKASVIESWQLAANRPPCIDRTDPDFRDAAKVLVLYGDPTDAVGQVFDATHVSDDVAEHRYAWSTSASAEGPYAPLPSQPGRAVTLPANFVDPGESFFLRLAVSDGHGPAPRCAASDLRCDEPLPDGQSCYRWVTWRVEYR